MEEREELEKIILPEAEGNPSTDLPPSTSKDDNDNKDKNNSAKLYTSMLTVGAIAFGGGTSTIPIFEKNCVERDKLIMPETFTDQIVVANITPGAVPIKLGCGIGMESKGVFGGIFGSWLVTLPGMLLTVILVSLLGLVSNSFITYLGFASIGVTVFVLYLMIEYICKIIREGKKEKNLIAVMAIITISFILTVGGKLTGFINGLFGTQISYNPIFSLSVIEIIISCFYIILFTSGRLHKVKTPICAAILIFYFVVAGNRVAIDWLLWATYGAMILSFAIDIIVRKIKKRRVAKSNLSTADTTKKEGMGRALFKELELAIKISCIFILFIVLYTIILMLIDWENKTTVLSYCLNGCLSVLTTFGGGAIYYPVAEGIFVEGGFITAQVFNIELITVVNAMPGPVLVKMLSAIGYKIGFGIAGSIVTGYLYSLLGLFIGVGISGTTFVLIFKVFKFFGKLEIFSQIRKFILPAICGLLLSTLISLLSSCFGAGMQAGVAGFYTILVIAAIYAVTYLICKKTKLPEIIPILGGGGVTLGLYALIMLI